MDDNSIVPGIMKGSVILATCNSSIQSYFQIDLDLTMLFHVYFLYRKSGTVWATDKELSKAGQE